MESRGRIKLFVIFVVLYVLAIELMVEMRRSLETGFWDEHWVHSGYTEDTLNLKYGKLKRAFLACIGIKKIGFVTRAHQFFIVLFSPSFNLNLFTFFNWYLCFNILLEKEMIIQLKFYFSWSYILPLEPPVVNLRYFKLWFQIAQVRKLVFAMSDQFFRHRDYWSNRGI